MPTERETNNVAYVEKMEKGAKRLSYGGGVRTLMGGMVKGEGGGGLSKDKKMKGKKMGEKKLGAAVYIVGLSKKNLHAGEKKKNKSWVTNQEKKTRLGGDKKKQENGQRIEGSLDWEEGPIIRHERQEGLGTVELEVITEWGQKRATSKVVGRISEEPV